MSNGQFIEDVKLATRCKRPVEFLGCGGGWYPTPENILEKISRGVQMKLDRPESLYDRQTHYCGGCGHGIAHRLVAEAIDELGIREKTIGTAPVGCAVFFYDYFNCDIIECAHGRSPAAATAIKRIIARPYSFYLSG